MAAGRALVDALRQRAHLGDALGDLLAEQHAAAAGLGALADHDLDGIGPAQIVAGSCRSARADIDRPGSRNGRALPASCRRRRWSSRCPPIVAPRPSASLACADSEPKLMPAMVIGIFSSIGFLAKRVPSDDVGAALLAIAFQRIARHRGAEKQQIVEMRQLALGAAAADIIDAGRRGAADFGQRIADRRSPTCAARCAWICDAARVDLSRRPRCRRGSDRASRAEP